MSRKTQIFVAVAAATALIATLAVWRAAGPAAVGTESFVNCPVEGCVAGSVGTASGHLWLEHQDIADDPVTGALGIHRTYLRDDSTGTSFGAGWRSILDTRLVSRSERLTLVGFPSLPGAPLWADDNLVTFVDGTRWGFDNDGALVSISNRAGRSFRIDRVDRKVRVLDGDDAILDVRYNSDGRVDRAIDRRPDGAGTVSYEYEAARLATVSVSDGTGSSEIYRYGYNPSGGLTRVIDSGGTTQFIWTEEHTVRRIDMGGQLTDVELAQSSADPTRVTLPGATKPTEYRHDAAGRLIEIRQGRSVVLRRQYGPEGQLLLDRDAADERRFDWVDGRLTRVTSEMHGSTELRWDDLGRLAATRHAGTETSYEYDGGTWSPSKVTRGDATTEYAYRDGVLVEVTDPDGVTSKVQQPTSTGLTSVPPPLSEATPECNSSSAGLVLDLACRPAGLRLENADGATTAESSITYDDFGRVATTTGSHGTERFTYDERGRIGAVERGGVTFTNEYAGGRLTRVTTGDGSVFAEYGYDDLGRLSQLSSGSGSAVRSYDNAGRVERIEQGGLVWEVTDYSPAGRPRTIVTPYGIVEIAYAADGRVERTEVRGQDGPDNAETITTDYAWTSNEDGEVAKVSRGGYVAAFGFDDGKLRTARTPLGLWSYAYDKTYPQHLARVSGPNGVTSYKYETDRSGSPKLAEVRKGDTIRRLSWDEFGRLTKDQLGEQERSFRYRPNGVAEEGSSSRSVTWDRTGLPVKVESQGATEHWAWNENRTLRSITVRGRGLPFPSDDQVWTARYEEGRLVGFDKKDSDDDVAIDWADEPGEIALPREVRRGNEDGVSLRWTETGDLERAGIGDQEWRISRDEFRNITEVARSGDGRGTLRLEWRSGLPVGVSSGEDSMLVEDCTESDCSVELVRGGTTTRVQFAEESITSTSDDTETVFDRDERGLITSGCQQIDGEQVCTDWQSDGEVGDRTGLARFESLLGGTNGQLRGLAARPWPADPLALTTLPPAIAPEGLEIRLPDEELDAAIEAAAPAMPESYRLGADGAASRLAARLVPEPVRLAIGPGQLTSLAVFEGDGLSEFVSPFEEDQPVGAAATALAGLEPNSILSGVVDTVKEYGLDVIALVAQVLPGGIDGVVALVAAAIECKVGSPNCVAQAVTGALMLISVIGPIGALLERGLAAVIEGVAAVASGASWSDAALSAGTAMLLGLAVRQARSLEAVCGLQRVWCVRASNTPEAAATAIEARERRWGLLTVDRANQNARRAEALRGIPRRPGFDRDEFPPAVTRQGGVGATVRYIDPSDNRAAGASLAATTRNLSDGQHFVYLVVRSRDRPLMDLERSGALTALLPRSGD